MGTETKLALEGTIGLREARQLRERLDEALKEFNVVEVDVAGLIEADVSIIQLLIAARKSAQQHGRTITVAGAAGAFEVMLSRAGFHAGQVTQ